MPLAVRHRSVLALAALLGGGALVACQVIAGLELPAFVEADAAAPEAGAEAGAVLGACDPLVPANARRATGGTNEVHFAAEFFDFGARSEEDGGVIDGDPTRLCVGKRPDGTEIDNALDLDGVQTCAQLPDGGVQANSCRARAEVCDPVGGGDNKGLSLATISFGATTNASSDPNVLIRQGRATLLLRLSAYNGRDDDDEVRVGIIQGLGLAADGGIASPDSGITPKFDGTDEWVADEKSVPPEQPPRVMAQTAYVVDGLLVARFRGATVSFGGSGTDLTADELVLTGQLVKDGRGQVLRLDKGRLAARLPATTLWKYATGRSLSGNTVCNDPELRKKALDLVCNSLDLPSGDQVFAPDEPCDAVSYAAGFYATRANLARDPKPGPDASPPFSCTGWPPTSCDDR